ncbi:family 4 carbohydrate esterase [Melampsora larici-populina 98AG31]|uniref:Family 4 carbohydrate esterase n=1 Tax=Melampsora larici-populina (strain 98AG31 / pathotype 3-4-7) TaxID=747676 RepID=F4RV90_MELLP|nr:family 4 carbohydrate esterase [Melampsora larici-populina 98AG31]EGG03711.1 family 4 carbohydrate esterase [Melampsora larici-populina 98AG31]
MELNTSPQAQPQIPVELNTSPRAQPQIPMELNTSPQVQPPRNLTIFSACKKQNSMALTFDDGPSKFSKTIDQILAQSGAKASFFVNGNNVGCIYDHAEDLRSRYEAGHLIGNHGWGHVHMKTADREQMHDQIGRVEDAMIKILGVKPLYFRPPYGEYNRELVQVLKQRGYRAMVLWSHDSGDSLEEPPPPREIITTYEEYKPKQIILNHESHESTVNEPRRELKVHPHISASQVMPEVIPQLRQRGLEMVSVGECHSASESDPRHWYEVVGPPGTPDSSWTCQGTPGPGEL